MNLEKNPLLLIYQRFFDLILISFLILICSPIILAVSILVLLFDGRPIFFSQTRIGKNSIKFQIYKFRTMTIHEEKGIHTTIKNDFRVTKLGTILRKYKLDELPQLINVIIGNMAVVGPRPTVQSDFNKMDKIQKGRVNVKPGLTGWAQVNGNTSLKWSERIILDLEYINLKSWLFDAYILALTLKKLILGRIHSDPPSSGEW